jgi:hypothetical protein
MSRRGAVGFGLALVLFAIGCKSPLAPVALDEAFELAPGDRVFVEDATFRIELLDVSGDSRCPLDAICVWAGDATVHVGVSEVGSTARYELHTGDAARMTITHRGFVIRLVELQPYPVSTHPIAPADYRATLRVTRN